jgi:uncharacterized protein
VLFEVKDVDRGFFAERLDAFLPARIIDFHTHIWLKRFQVSTPVETRGPTWPRRVAEDDSIEDLIETYRLMFPGHEVTPMVFGWPERDTDLDKTNDYTAGVGRDRGFPSLLVTSPEWTAEELESRVLRGGFIGLKPYLNQAPVHIPSAEITTYDFLPHHHLELAEAHGWIVLLHIPRPARLRDPLNLAHLQEIERRYPHIHLIVAHVGRAYCPEDVGDALDVLRETRDMAFDFSANTNAQVIEQTLRAVGPRRLIFGSDLPITHMRMRRICENGSYVNLVPPGLYGDVSDDEHMREVSPQEGGRLSFFLYEQLAAFRSAAEAVRLAPGDVEDVMCNNAARLIAAARAGA